MYNCLGLLTRCPRDQRGPADNDGELGEEKNSRVDRTETEGQKDDPQSQTRVDS